LRIFLDSNVWISAFTARGLCADLVRLLLRRHGRGSIDVLLGAPVREETLRILARRFGATGSDLAYVRMAMDAAENVPASSADPPGDIPDPADAPIVACALAARADLFVTGDKELLDMNSFEGMRLVSPRAMYERLIRGK